MARVKQTVSQRSFDYGELREDFLERDDLEPRQRSFKAARNMRVLSTGATEQRPGLEFMGATSADALEIIEIRPGSSEKYGLIVYDDSLRVINSSGNVVFEQTNVPWTDADSVWVTPFRDQTVIGDPVSGLNILNFIEGVWSFDDFAFEEAPGGEVAQPYWAFQEGINITPSNTTGAIEITASASVFSASYVGQRIRYSGREIRITGYTSPTLISGTVVNELPPTYRIVVADASEFRVGEAVVGADTGYQGFITRISGTTLTCVTQEFFEGPDVFEELSGPGGSSAVSSKTKVSPAESPIWDEPLMSPARGYPRSATSAAGRMVFLDFPQVPDAIAISSSRSIFDFTGGAQDDDAITRTIGDNSPRWLHAVNIGDLILLSDRGVYSVPIRENRGVISPSTFETIFIDDASASTINPVKVEDGVLFVDGSGEMIKGVMLDGNIYLKWSVMNISEYHSHLIKSPVALCGPALESAATEKYVFVVNSDGTLAALSWQDRLRDEVVGFIPWDTAGNFISVSPVFNGYWAIVERQINGSTVRYVERFNDAINVDSGVIDTQLSIFTNITADGSDLTAGGEPIYATAPYLTHLVGETVAYYIEGWDAGDFTVNSDGTITGEPTQSGTREVGLNFVCTVQPWPVELIESPRDGYITARVMEVGISVQNTLAFTAICNGVENSIEAYGFGDDLSSPPPLKEAVYRFSIFGNRDHPSMIFERRRPGPFRVLKLVQRVQG